MGRLCSWYGQQGLKLFLPCTVNQLQLGCELSPVDCPDNVIPVQLVESATQSVLKLAAGMKQQAKRVIQSMYLENSGMSVVGKKAMVSNNLSVHAENTLLQLHQIRLGKTSRKKAVHQSRKNTGVPKLKPVFLGICLAHSHRRNRAKECLAALILICTVFCSND